MISEEETETKLIGTVMEMSMMETLQCEYYNQTEKITRAHAHLNATTCAGLIDDRIEAKGVIDIDIKNQFLHCHWKYNDMCDSLFNIYVLYI